MHVILCVNICSYKTFPVARLLIPYICLYNFVFVLSNIWHENVSWTKEQVFPLQEETETTVVDI